VFLLYHSSCKPTGRKLGGKLIELRPHGVHYGISPERASAYSPVIRWGYSGIIPGVFDEGDILQPLHSMQMAQNKYETLCVLDGESIPVPPFYPREHVDEARHRGAITNQIFFLRKFHHTRGEDIRIVNGLDHWSRMKWNYAVEYVPTHKEYRVHVFDGKVLFVQKKVFDPELFNRICDERSISNADRDILEETREMVRNYSHGYKFISVNNHQRAVPPSVIKNSLEAIEALGLDFGAVDISSLDERDRNGKRKSIVWEVNTAPAIDTERGLEAYARAIINHRWRRR
jgi:hypothetical protein